MTRTRDTLQTLRPPGLERTFAFAATVVVHVHTNMPTPSSLPGKTFRNVSPYDGWVSLLAAGVLPETGDVCAVPFAGRLGALGGL